MHIAVNLRLYFRGKIGGLENYVRQIITGVAAEHQLTIFCDPTQIHHVREFAPDATLIEVPATVAVSTLQRELATGNFNLYFCPLLVLEPLRPPLPCAVTISDIQHEFHPEFFDAPTLRWRKQTYGPSARQANAVFTVSEYSKATIVEKFGIDPKKVHVVDHDADEEFYRPAFPSAAQAFRELQLPVNYLYYPANYWPHKNHTNLLAALELLVNGEFPQLQLVLTGSAEHAGPVQAEIKRRKLTKHVRLLPYQPRAVVAEIYRHARALPFVSRFEGFGIPLLEAFHTNTPVVSSRACSCPEVAGDAAIYVNELDPADIAAGIARVLTDEPLRAQLTARGRERAKRYSWRGAIEQTLAAFHKISQERPLTANVEVHTHPTVGIVTPTYNMARFLPETIESVLSQDYPHIDYLVMDGGSTDDTRAVLEKYGKRIRWISERDKGQADAINKGAAAVKGEIFTFLNADDTYLPGAVSTAVRHLRENPSMGVVYGEANYVAEDGSLIAPYPVHPFDPQLLAARCYICQPAAFMLREAWDAVGGIDATIQCSMDYDLWIRIAKLYPMLKVDETLATSRMYSDNKTLRMRRYVYEETMRITERHYQYVPYELLYGYISHRLDGKDQVFETSSPSLTKYLLTLGVGLWRNRLQARRYWREWAGQMGIGREFTGQFPDGWISRRYITERFLSKESESVIIKARNNAPLLRKLTVSVKLNGMLAEQRIIRDRKPFTLTIPCPPEVRGKQSRLEIECGHTFRPWHEGDYRRLGILLEGIEVVEAQPAEYS